MPQSGFACFVGRPNTGKSTLLNAIIGTKVAITSDRPQTTRRTIRGIVNRPNAQLIIVDTPGLHRPRTLLGERLNDQVRETLANVDVVGMCFPANEAIGPGDKFIAANLPPHVPRIAILTKVDLVPRDQVAQRLVELQDFGTTLNQPWVDIIPVSAISDANVQTLVDCLIAQLPEGPPLYPDAGVTDQPIDVSIAELIREAALEGVEDELPHSIAVTVEEMDESEGLTTIHAKIYVERESQKGIVIGKRGARLKQVGITARAGIEELLGTRVYLDLHVTVAKDWQRDPKQLRRLGF